MDRQNLALIMAIMELKELDGNISVIMLNILVKLCLTVWLETFMISFPTSIHSETDLRKVLLSAISWMNNNLHTHTDEENIRDEVKQFCCSEIVYEYTPGKLLTLNTYSFTDIDLCGNASPTP